MTGPPRGYQSADAIGRFRATQLGSGTLARDPFATFAHADFKAAKLTTGTSHGVNFLSNVFREPTLGKDALRQSRLSHRVSCAFGGGVGTYRVPISRQSLPIQRFGSFMSRCLSAL